MHGLRIRERLQKQYAQGDVDQHGAPLDQQPQQPMQRREPEPWPDIDESKVGHRRGPVTGRLIELFLPFRYSSNRGDISLLPMMWSNRFISQTSIGSMPQRLQRRPQPTWVGTMIVLARTRTRTSWQHQYLENHPSFQPETTMPKWKWQRWISSLGHVRACPRRCVNLQSRTHSDRKRQRHHQHEKKKRILR